MNVSNTISFVVYVRYPSSLFPSLYITGTHVEVNSRILQFFRIRSHYGVNVHRSGFFDH